MKRPMGESVINETLAGERNCWRRAGGTDARTGDHCRGFRDRSSIQISVQAVARKDGRTRAIGVARSEGRRWKEAVSIQSPGAFTRANRTSGFG